MHSIRSRLKATVVLAAAAVLVLAISCGGGDEGTATPSPSLTPVASPTALPTVNATTEAVSGPIVDLATQSPQLIAVASDSEDLLSGPGILSAGDFNGDGTTDIIIGAPQADGPDNSRKEAGEAYVIFGPLEGTLDLDRESVDLMVIGALEGDNLGFSVLGGDLNGDGIDDVIVGAPGVTAGEDLRTDQGRAYVFFGSEDLGGERDLAEDVYDFVVTGAEGFSRIGHAMALGDVNGDSLADLVLGAPFAGRKPGTPPGSERTEVGEVYAVFGSTGLSGEVSIPSLQQDVTLSGSQGRPRHGQFGATVAVADVNGDGIDDIVVGAHRSDSDGDDRTASGAAYVFLGARDLSGRLTITDGDQAMTILGATANAGFGSPITTGDFNGDGTADIAIGAPIESSDDSPASGIVRIFYGGSDLEGTIDLAEESADVRILGTGAGELLPSSLAAADLDGDGADDLLIGASLADAPGGRVGAGRVYALLSGADLQGTVDLAVDTPTLTVVAVEAQDRLGSALAIADASSDGGVLLIVAATGADGEGNERPEAGEVYVVPLRFP